MDKVSVIRFNNVRENIARAVEQVNGLASLRPSDHILLKPNLVMWDNVYPFPKYGVLTSTVLMEEMVRLLSDYGCTKISIGEGSIIDRGFGSDTKAAFAGLGYHKLREKYGVKLIDFNDGPFTSVDFNEFSLDISAHALETDFFVNLPVLKTHNSTKVSLGFKNLKGCLATRSKMFCHHVERTLDDFICHIGEKIRPALTVIDGIYALEKGPVINGRAYRTDLIIASRDMFAADVTGARILGFDPAEIGYLREYANRHSLSLHSGETVGEKVDDVVCKLQWDWTWLEDNSGPEAFARQGITGIHFPKYDNTICSGCSYLNNYLLVTLMGAYANKPVAGIEFLGGKNCRSQGGADKTFLFGKCAIHANKENPVIKEAVPIRGCPPDKDKIISVLREHGIEADENAYTAYRAGLFKRYEGRADFQEDHFNPSK
ncbi:MAG: DUF362 domain-containing protein [Clostridiales bacterium]|jgi:uncharacterized protein (DUF362 family)|nr:DUF362 domain-containing protein [Clostridiales bacterium]